MANAFDRFDVQGGEPSAQPARNPFDAFDEQPTSQQPVAAEAEDGPGLFSNSLRNAGERGFDILGNFIQFIGNTAEKGEKAITEKLGGFNPGLVVDKSDTLRGKGYEPDFEIGGYGLDFTTKVKPEDTDTGLVGAGQAVEDVTLGYQPKYTIDKALDEPTLRNLAGAAAEQGPAALSDMVALIISTPAYLAARTQEIGEARVENDKADIDKASPELQKAIVDNFANGTEVPEDLQQEAEQLAENGEMPELKEYLIAGPTAAASVILDRFALGKILPGGGKAITSAKQIPGAAGRAFVTEGGTELVQEGGIEYAGESVGTEAGWQPNTAARRGLGGLIVGGPVGGVVGGGSAAYEASTANRTTESDPPVVQDQIKAEPETAPVAEPPVIQDRANQKPDNAPVNDYYGRPDWANDQTNIFRDGVKPEATVGGNPFDAFDQAPQPEPNPEQSAQDEAPKQELEGGLTEQGTGVFRVPVDQINVDPEQYQFRSKVDGQGVDKRLSEIQQWDDDRAGTVLLHRREDGSLYVADGHHRVDLAKRLGQTELNARIVDEADGVGVPQARLRAAMNNVADGKAEPIDVAKVFRDSETPASEVRKIHNLPASQVVRDGEALSKLSDNVFGMVTSGQVSEKDGATIGAAFAEQSQQEAAADAFQKIEPQTDYQRQLLVNEIRSAEFAQAQGEQSGLFGDDAQEISLMQDRLKVLEVLRQQLNIDKRLFKSLNVNAEKASEAGNRIATEANESITQQSARTLDLISRVTTTPALNEMVNRAARRVYDGESRASVAKDLKRELMNYEQGTAPESSGRPDPAPRSRPVTEKRPEPRASQPVPEPDTTGADQGGQPESGQPAEVSPSLELTTQTEAELAEQARAQQEAADTEARQKREAEQREQADAEADDFTLAGSNSPIDKAEARGQDNLFDQPATTSEQVEQAAADVDQTPTEAQIEAGNYKKGHVTVQGLNITLENPRGSTRSGTDPDGNDWSVTMAHHYGYLKRTEGADGEHVDVFVGPRPESEKVYVIDQVDSDVSFDEVKVMLGFASKVGARRGYLSNYEKGWTGLGAITETNIDDFKAWVKNGDTKLPFASGEAWASVSAGVSGLASDETAVPQSKKQAVSAVRSQRNSDTPDVDRELQDIPSRRGRSAGQENDIGAKGQQQGIRARERRVGDDSRSSQEQAEQRLADSRRTNDDSGGLGERNRNRQRSAESSDQRVRMERGESADNAAKSAQSNQQDANLQGQDSTNGRLGQRSGNELQDAKKPNRQPRLDDREVPGSASKAETKPAQQPEPADTAPEQQPKKQAELEANTVTAQGVTVQVPTIDQQLVDDFNRNTYIAGKRDLNQELRDTATAVLDNLADKPHTLVTDEQKAKAKELVEAYLKKMAEFDQWDASFNARNPSWIVTGRSNRNMAKANAKNEKHMDEYSRRFGLVEAQRKRIPETLYDMRPKSIKDDQAVKADQKRITQLVADIAMYMNDGRDSLESATRKWASPKAHKAIEKALERDRMATLRHIQETEKSKTVTDLGGLVKILGPRSKAGKLVQQLLDEPLMVREQNGVSYYRVSEDQIALDFDAEPDNDGQAGNLPGGQRGATNAQQAADAGRGAAKLLRQRQFTRQVERQSFFHGQRQVTSAAEAAHVLAPFRKDAHETMLALVMDADRKPLAIIRHSKGTVDGAAVYPDQLLGDIVSVPGAASLWISHNHPSGTMAPSKADLDLTQRLMPLLKNAKIDLEGHVIIGFGRAHTAFQLSDRSDGGDSLTTAAVRKHKIPVLERQIARKKDESGSIVIKDPKSAVTALKQFASADQTGVLLLDNKHKAVGFLDLSGYDLGALKKGNAYRDVLQAMAATNANAGIVQAGSGVSDTDNLQRMLGDLAEFRLLDAVHVNILKGRDTDYTSVQVAGSGLAGAGAWLSRTGYRRTPQASPNALTKAQAQAVTDTLMADWKGRPKVTVADSISEFPKGLRDAIRDANAESDMRGALWRDTVYVLASRIPDRMRMEQVILHEVVGHYGLRKMLGKDMERVLNQIWVTHGGQTRAKFIINRYFKTKPFDANNKEHRHIVAEELIAHLAEQNRGQTLVQRAVAIIRDGLRKLGFTMEFTVDDIVNLLRRSRKTVESGGFETEQSFGLGAVAASKFSKSGRTDQTNADAFREWFGDSKAVDESGAPLRVYHGTNSEFTEFNREARGSNTAWENTNLGFYFIADRALAQEFAEQSGGDTVMDTYLSIQKPLNLTRQELFSNQGQAATIYEAMTGEQLSGTEALEAINDEIGLGEIGDAMNALATDEAKAIMERDGYDGVISEYGDGVLEYVAFNPEQIKSATNNAGTFDPANPDIRFSRAGRSGSDRAAWPADFPKVPFAAPLGTAQKHPDYQAAKSGDVEAARKLVDDTVTDEAIARIRDMVGDRSPIVVPAFAEEAAGRNMIPVAYAVKIAKALNLTVDQGIIQSVRAKRTGEGADYRLANHAVFDGAVERGQDYLVVDDTMTMGGTLASLRGHIEANGGKVVGATTLTGFGQQGQLALTEKMRQDLWRKHGEPLNDYLQEEFGYGIDSLTQGEAGHFRKANNLDAIRDRITAARPESGSSTTDGVTPPGARFSRTGIPDLDPQPFGPPSDTLIRRLVSKIADKHTVLKGVQKNIQDQFGEIPEPANAYRAEELFHGKVENDIRLIEENMVEPLAKAMSKNDVSLGQLDEFLYALHAPERNAVIAERNPEMPDGGSGMTDAEAAAIINKVDRAGNLAAYQSLAKRVHDMLAMRRKILKSAGLLDEDTVGAWEASYKHYVPLKGWAVDETQPDRPRIGKGFAISGKESQLAAGRKSRAASPVANSISDLSEAVLRHRKNEVGNSFMDLVQAYPNDNYWRVYTDENPEVERKAVRVKDPDTGKGKIEVREQTVPMAMMSDRYFTTKVNGKTHYIKIEDQRLMNAMRNIGPDNSNLLIRSLASVTRVMSSLNTSYNPEFVISNFSRDIQTALLNLTSEQSSDDGKVRGKKIAAKTLKDVGTSIRAINASLKGNALPGKAGEWQKHFDQFRQDGAKTGWFDMKDIDGQMRDLEKMIAVAGGGAVNTTRRAFKITTDWVENTNSAIENGVRLSAYVNAIEAGISRPQAASLAKNMTVNFNRKGELGTMMNALYMFANASVQGTANFVRTLGRLNGVKGDPMWSRMHTAQKIAVGMAVGGFMLSLLNRLVAGEDDDEVNWWDKVPDYVKERNIVLMKSLVGGEPGEYWTIPLPYGYNIFPVIGTSMEHMAFSDKSAGDIAGNVVLAALGSFSPIGFEESKEAYGVIAKNIMPTILRPVASISLNENFMGGPIFKENFPFGTQKPDSALYFRSTPEAFKALAEGLNDATGGSEFRSGAVDLSPDVMQFLVGYYGGGAYDFFTSRTPNLATKLVTRVELEDREVPFWRKLSGKVLPYEDQSSFYDRRNEIDQLVSERENLRGPERIEFIKDYRNKLRLQSAVKSTENRLKMLRKQRDRIELMDLPAAEEDEKLQQVEKQMKRAIDQFNKRYNEAED